MTQALAERRLAHFLRKARTHATLSRRVRASGWSADVVLVSSARMTRLNAKYRRKRYATDVLSFEAPAVFRREGRLGELVICTAVLKRQAREHGHSAAHELDVLIVHGILHLLGFDHERGAAAARAQARWEQTLLGARKPGMLARSRA